MAVQAVGQSARRRARNVYKTRAHVGARRRTRRTTRTEPPDQSARAGLHRTTTHRIASLEAFRGPACAPEVSASFGVTSLSMVGRNRAMSVGGRRNLPTRGQQTVPTGGHDSPRRSLAEMGAAGRNGAYPMPSARSIARFSDAHYRQVGCRSGPTPAFRAVWPAQVWAAQRPPALLDSQRRRATGQQAVTIAPVEPDLTSCERSRGRELATEP
jgi:hypothetical protein